jgi:hypothetical protein
MRQLHYILVLALLVVFALPGVVTAAPGEVFTSPTAVLLVGDATFRLPDFYKIIETKLSARFPQLIVGEEIQTSYRKFYWDSKGLLKADDLPARQDLFAFIKTLPYERVLVLAVIEPSSEDRNIFLWFFTLTQSRAILQVRAILVDSAAGTVIADHEVLQKGPLGINGGLSAKRGCFKQVMDILAADL